MIGLRRMTWVIWFSCSVSCADDAPSDTTDIANEVVDTVDVAGLESTDTDPAFIDSTDIGVVVPDLEPVSLLQIDLNVQPAALASLDQGEVDEVECKIAIGAIQFSGAKLELHGGNASKGPKKSYRVILPKIASGGLNLFGFGPESSRRFVLNSSWVDPTFVRNKLTLDAVRTMGGLAPRVGFAVVSVLGRYHGLYTLIERVDADYLKNQGFSGEGNLYKAETSDADWSGSQGVMAGFDHELKAANLPNGSDLESLWAVLQFTPPLFSAFVEAVEPQLDLNAVMTWQLVHVLAHNVDTFNKNYYLYHETDGEHPFTVISWDADATWGFGETGEPVPFDDWHWYGTDRFAPRLFSIDEYKVQYLQRFQNAVLGELSGENLIAQVDHYVKTIQSEALRDTQKWHPGVDFNAKVVELRQLIQQRHVIVQNIIDIVR